MNNGKQRARESHDMNITECCQIISDDSHSSKVKMDALVKTLSTATAHVTTEYGQLEVCNRSGEREFITDYDRPVAVIIHSQFASDVPDRIISVLCERTDIEVQSREYVDDVGQRGDAEYQVRLSTQSLR
jgi:hypothetical protein